MEFFFSQNVFTVTEKTNIKSKREKLVFEKSIVLRNEVRFLIENSTQQYNARRITMVIATVLMHTSAQRRISRNTQNKDYKNTVHICL